MQWGEGQQTQLREKKSRKENRKTNKQLNKQTNMEAKRDNEEKIQLIGWVLDKGTCKIYPWSLACFIPSHAVRQFSIHIHLVLCPLIAAVLVYTFLDVSVERTLGNAKLLRSSCDGTSIKRMSIKECHIWQ